MVVVVACTSVSVLEVLPCGLSMNDHQDDHDAGRCRGCRVWGGRVVSFFLRERERENRVSVRLRAVPVDCHCSLFLCFVFLFFEDYSTI